MCTRFKRWKFQLDSMIVAGNAVKRLNKITSLDVKIDLNLSFTLQTNNIYSSCNSQLSKLYRTQRYLNLEDRIMLVNSLIISRLDYGNIILNGAPKYLFAKLQRVPNAACRFIFRLRKYDSYKDFRHHLHWLPIEQRVIFKTMTLMHKKLRDREIPVYLIGMASFQRHCNTTRTSNIFIAELKSAKKSFGNRAFSVLARKQWNSLPLELRSILDLYIFKRTLKTYLFKSAFGV